MDTSQIDDYLQSLQKRVSAARLRVQQDFYYLESEQLRYRPNPKSWNIIEVFEHINLTNEFYTKQLSLKVENKGNKKDRLKRGWFGKFFANSLKPGNEVIGFKMKTFNKVNPTKRRKKGIAITEHIVFQDLIDSMEQLDNLLEKAKGKNLSSVKVQSLSPLIKFDIYNAFDVVVSHMERHIQQALNILDNA